MFALFVLRKVFYSAAGMYLRDDNELVTCE